MSKTTEYVAAVKEAVKLEQKFKTGEQTRAYITEDEVLVIVGGPFKFEDAIPLARWILEVFKEDG